MMSLKPKFSHAVNLFLSSILVASLLTVEGCKHAPLVTDDLSNSTPVPVPVDTSSNNNNNNNEIPCDPDSVYFENTILPLLNSSCAKSGCHDAITHKKGIILDSYANIMATGDITPGNPNKGDMVEKITETNPNDVMPPPPNAPLTAQQIALISQWISQGAQNNHCFECDTNNVTFSGKIKPIIDTKCIGCHNANSTGGGYNLTTYNGVLIAALNGALYGAVSHTGGYSNMPKNSQQLPDCEIDAIRIWIDAGAPNN